MTGLFSKKILTNIILFTAIIPIATYFIYFLLTTEIMTDEGPMSKGLQNFLTVAVILIDISWIYSLFSILLKCLSKKVFVIDENGISDTFFIHNLFAFIFVFRIKLIPWDAILTIEKNEYGISVMKIDVQKIQAGFITKLFLKSGFIMPPYCKNYTNQEIDAEILKYTSNK